MLQKTKERCSKLALTALALIKRNIPAAVSLALTVTAVVLTVACSAHTVTVSDGRRTYVTSGLSSDLGLTLNALSLKSSNYEIVDVSNNLFATKVEIDYLVPLTLKIGDKTSTHMVREDDLSTILSSLNIEIDEHDTVSLPKYSYIDKATTVEITDVEYENETRLISCGKNQTKTVVYSVKYVNGVATEYTPISEKMGEYSIDDNSVEDATAPLYAGNGVTHANNVSSISKLDAPNDLLLDAEGKPLKYSSKKTLHCTAYTHTGNKMSTGKYPKPGYVAVDPREIPYGTKMYITSADGKYVYGYAIAADTGGFIYNSRTDLDLFLDSESQCVTFGRRDMIVYFVD